MRNDLDVNAAIVSVASPANGAVGRRVVDVVWCNPFRAYTIDDEMIAVKEFQYDRQLILQVMC